MESLFPDSNKRIKVKLNVKGVVKRRPRTDVKGATKYYVRRENQFIYGKQNLFKGAFGVIPAELDGFESSADLPAFDVDKSCNSEWIYYFLRNGRFYENLINLSSGTGSRRVQPKRLYDLEIPLPERKIQDELISSFTKIDSLVEFLEKRIKQNQENINDLRKTIFQKAVSGKLVPQDPKDEPASQLLKRIKVERERLIKEKKTRKKKQLLPILDEEMPHAIPKSWVWVRTSDIVDVETGATPHSINSSYYNGKIPWITSSSTNSLFITSAENHITKKALKETNCKIFPKNTLIVAMYGQGKTRGQVSELLIESATNQACAALLFNSISKDCKNYTKLAFRKIYDSIRELASGGAQPNLNLTKIKNTLVPLPPLNEQKRIIKKVDRLMQLCDELEEKTKENRKTSKLLMEAVLREAFDSSE